MPDVPGTWPVIFHLQNIEEVIDIDGRLRSVGKEKKREKGRETLWLRPTGAQSLLSCRFSGRRTLSDWERVGCESGRIQDSSIRFRTV